MESGGLILSVIVSRTTADARIGEAEINVGYESGKIRGEALAENIVSVGTPELLPNGDSFAPVFLDVQVRFNVADVLSERDRILSENKPALDAIESSNGKAQRLLAELNDLLAGAAEQLVDPPRPLWRVGLRCRLRSGVADQTSRTNAT